MNLIQINHVKNQLLKMIRALLKLPNWDNVSISSQFRSPKSCVSIFLCFCTIFLLPRVSQATDRFDSSIYSVNRSFYADERYVCSERELPAPSPSWDPLLMFLLSDRSIETPYSESAMVDMIEWAIQEREKICGGLGNYFRILAIHKDRKHNVDIIARRVGGGWRYEYAISTRPLVYADLQRKAAENNSLGVAKTDEDFMYMRAREHGYVYQPVEQWPNTGVKQVRWIFNGNAQTIQSNSPAYRVIVESFIVNKSHYCRDSFSGSLTDFNWVETTRVFQGQANLISETQKHIGTITVEEKYVPIYRTLIAQSRNPIANFKIALDILQDPKSALLLGVDLAKMYWEVATFVKRNGCQSAAMQQMDENIFRLATGQPSVQEAKVSIRNAALETSPPASFNDTAPSISEFRDILNYDWQDADQKLRKQLAEKLPDDEKKIALNPSTSVRFSFLDWYSKSVRIVQIKDRSDNRPTGGYYLYGNFGNLIRLGGKDTAINAFNRLYDINITSETVMDYLWFYTFFVRDHNSIPYLIIKDVRSAFFPFKKAGLFKKGEIDYRDPVVTSIKGGNTGDETFSITANVYYDIALYLVTFVVDKSGKVDVKEGRELVKIGERANAPL